MQSRKEERYYLATSALQEFLTQIKPISSQRNFLTDYNHTLYFNNTEHEVPFELSIKARRYSASSLEESFELTPDTEWIFELKRDLIFENTRFRKKERSNLQLQEIIKQLQCQNNVIGAPITINLTPYVANAYTRQHFHIGGIEEFRITIDSSIGYYLFESGFKAKQIGKEDYARIELKVPIDKLDSLEFKKVQILLKELGAENIISKKDMAYNLLTKYLRTKINRRVMPSDTEIEAKLLLEGKNQHVFHRIKQDFKEGNILGFKLLKEFPYTLEGGKIHRYFLIDGQSKRVSLKGELKKIISKQNLEIAPDPFNLNCIVKRREIKTPFNPDLTGPSQMIYRKRKYFLVENQQNGISYCILIDRCTCGHNELFQMEIEGLLLSSSGEPEKDIIEDIASIANQLVKKYNVLTPTTLTKLDWLKSLKPS